MKASVCLLGGGCSAPVEMMYTGTETPRTHFRSMALVSVLATNREPLAGAVPVLVATGIGSAQSAFSSREAPGTTPCGSVFTTTGAGTWVSPGVVNKLEMRMAAYIRIVRPCYMRRFDTCQSTPG
jgi:hypothetical protein